MMHHRIKTTTTIPIGRIFYNYKWRLLDDCNDNNYEVIPHGLKVPFAYADTDIENTSANPPKAVGKKAKVIK